MSREKEMSMERMDLLQFLLFFILENFSALFAMSKEILDSEYTIDT